MIDYRTVDPALGAWANVAEVGRSFRLMFDAVVNHASVQSAWFQSFLRDEEPYTDYFLVVEPDTDVSQVFRPRSLPLFTKVQTASGPKHVWTTFSDDQIDLNYASPRVLLEVLDILLFYVARGATYIRLDAIAFIWKEPQTTCIHLAETHHVIQLMRAVLDQVAPHVVLITETNVPHEENISYFGDGHNEAQMVYNFSLPPLVLHTFHTGNATTLARWARRLELPSQDVTFFNFLASHDGIGLTPARGLLTEAELVAMAQRVEHLGGYVSYRNQPDGSLSPYELNVNYLDALGTPEKEEPVDLRARRFLAAQAIMLALRGVPGIYFHSLMGSRNWREGAEASGRKRTINRQKLQRRQLEAELAAPDSLRHQVFYPYLHMLRQRAKEPAFHPTGGQEVLATPPAVFGLLRRAQDGHSAVICLHNVSDQPQPVELDLRRAGLPKAVFRNVLNGQRHESVLQQLTYLLRPYEVAWLREGGPNA